MPGQMDSTGLAVGLKKGFIVEKRKLAPKPASRKGVRRPLSSVAPCLQRMRPRRTRVRLVPRSRTLRGDAAVYGERVEACTSLERSDGVCVRDRWHGVGICPQQGRHEPSARPHACVISASHRPDEGQGAAASLLGRVALDLIGVYSAGSKAVVFATEGGSAGARGEDTTRGRRGWVAFCSGRGTGLCGSWSYLLLRELSQRAMGQQLESSAGMIWDSGECEKALTVHQADGRSCSFLLCAEAWQAGEARARHRA